MSSAFQGVDRTHVLQNAQTDAPNTYNFQRLTLSRSTPLFSSGRILYSESGVPQGCPLGPLGFSLGIQPIIRHISTHMGTWMMVCS